jgi:hypothetical protein
LFPEKHGLRLGGVHHDGDEDISIARGFERGSETAAARGLELLHRIRVEVRARDGDPLAQQGLRHAKAHGAEADHRYVRRHRRHSYAVGKL